MNKSELIEKIAADADMSKKQANDALNSFMEAVTKRAARNGRNPQTGATIKIKAKKVAKFKAGKELSSKI